MSAFMLAEHRFQQLADFLTQPIRRDDTSLAVALRPSQANLDARGALARADAGKLAIAIVRGWHRANVNAIAGRYGERGVDMGVDAIVFRKRESFGTGIIRPVEFVKLMDCLIYQCSEDVEPSQAEAHRIAMDEMDKARAIICGAIVRETPQYVQASWG